MQMEGQGHSMLQECFLMYKKAMQFKDIMTAHQILTHFNTRWRGGLARTLFKRVIVGLSVWQPSLKNTFFLLRAV